MKDGEPSKPDNALPPFAELFPEAICLSAIQELSAWTSVHDIAAAARCLADAPAPADFFDTRLIPFADNDALQAILIEAFGWLIKAYRVPPPKVLIAADIEPCLNAVRREILREAVFRPNASIGGPGAITAIAPSLAQHHNDRFLLVEDSAHVIELLQAPLRCLIDVVTKCFDTARKMGELKRPALDTSDKAPSIYHRPYADSQMPAILEALCFYAFALDFGPRWSTPGMADVVFGYRAVNVQARPPVDMSMLDAAKKSTARMLETLI